MQMSTSNSTCIRWRFQPLDRIHKDLYIFFILLQMTQNCPIYTQSLDTEVEMQKL